jgi:lauroyl/myristoyl acyltransferase
MITWGDVSTAETRDLSAALELARRPLQRPRMPRAGLALTLRTSTGLRRVVPTRLALARACAKGRAAWEDEAERSHALSTMRVILAGTPREREVEELARRRLIEEAARQALFWQPWRTAGLDAISRSNLERTVSANRGVLLSACHLGPYFLTMSALSSLGHHPTAVAAPWFFADPSPDYWGRRLARWWRGICARGERLAYAVGAFPVVRQLLQEGEIVLSYFDMPGSIRTQFLGKAVTLASGSARLATQADALILPLRPRRSGARVWTDVFEPLDPRQFASADELHVALAQVHERSILELPETLEDPNRAGAWEGGAGAREWARARPDGTATDNRAD